MRYGMHAIDLGIIITLIRAILHAFLGIVVSVVHIQGRSTKLEARLRNDVARKTGRDGQYIYVKYAVVICIEMCKYVIIILCQFQRNT